MIVSPQEGGGSEQAPCELLCLALAPVISVGASRVAVPWSTGKARKRVDSGMRKDLGLFVQSCYGRAVFASVPFVYWTAVPLPGASAIHLTGPLSLPSFAIKAACSKHSFTGLFVLKCVHPREGFQSWSFWAGGVQRVSRAGVSGPGGAGTHVVFQVL